MRVLMLNNEFPPLGGGTGVVNYHILDEIARSRPDIHIDLVTSSRTRSTYEEEQLAPGIRLLKVPVNNSNIHHSTNPELLRYFWRGLRLSHRLATENPYDLSFAFAGVPAGVISYILWLRFRLPYIVSLQGPDVPGFEARYNGIYPFLKPLLRRVWRSAKAVLAISQEHKRLAQETLRDIDIQIIYNGVCSEEFCPDPARSLDTCLTILCVGRLIERKGQHHLLKAFSLLPRDLEGRELRLVLVGTGDSESDLKRLAASLGVAERVAFAGFVLREDMPDVYREADIFVLPSQSEGMSIALLEAMASGLPVIVTDTGGTDELVSDGENGRVIGWGDIQGLAAAAQHLAFDGHLRSEMGRHNRSKVVAEYGWPSIVAKYGDLMAQACRPKLQAYSCTSDQGITRPPPSRVKRRKIRF